MHVVLFLTVVGGSTMKNSKSTVHFHTNDTERKLLLKYCVGLKAKLVSKPCEHISWLWKFAVHSINWQSIPIWRRKWSLKKRGYPLVRASTMQIKHLSKWYFPHEQQKAPTASSILCRRKVPNEVGLETGKGKKASSSSWAVGVVTKEEAGCWWLASALGSSSSSLDIVTVTVHRS